MEDQILTVPRSSLPDNLQHLEADFLGLPQIASREDVARVLDDDMEGQLHLIATMVRANLGERLVESAVFEIESAVVELMHLCDALAYYLANGSMPYVAYDDRSAIATICDLLPRIEEHDDGYAVPYLVRRLGRLNARLREGAELEARLALAGESAR